MLISIPAEVDPSRSRFQQSVDPYQSQEGFTSEVVIQSTPETKDSRTDSRSVPNVQARLSPSELVTQEYFHD